MKPAAVALAVLLAAACASPTAVVDKRVFRCGPGQDIDVRAGLDDGSINREIAGQLQYLVEVANNSHHDVTVSAIRVTPRFKWNEPVEGIESAVMSFDQLIPENDEHVFELPANASGPRSFERQIERQEIEFAVIVSLSNGDSYHCSFLAKWK